MSESGGGDAQGESAPKVPSPWSPGVRSATYLPKEAPTWLGPWRLPQVRAQALTSLIEDLSGWTRTVHGVLATALGASGAAALVYADSSLDGGAAATVVTVVGVLAVLGWAVWGLWLLRSAWLVIAAAGRWRSAPERGASSGARILSPGVGAFFVPLTIFRIIVALALIGVGIWRVLLALEYSGRGGAFMGWFSHLTLAAVLILGGLAVLAGVLGMVLALRRKPSEASGAPTGRFAPPQVQGSGNPQAPQVAPGGPQPVGGGDLHPGQGGWAQAVPGGWHGQPQGQVDPTQAPNGPGQPGYGHPVFAEPGYGQPGQPGYGHPEPGQPEVPGQPGFGPTDEGGHSGPSGDGPPGAEPASQPQSTSDEHEDLEQTRFAARLGPVPADSRTRAPIRNRVAVLLEDGRHLPDDATTLLGRAPQAKAGEQVEALLDLADPAVSKTHLEVRVRGGTVLAIDRASTNGTVLLSADGTESDLVPWQETKVTVGSTLMVGTTRILVLLPEDAR